jgi:hypothetical protein
MLQGLKKPHPVTGSGFFIDGHYRKKGQKRLEPFSSDFIAVAQGAQNIKNSYLLFSLF